MVGTTLDGTWNVNDFVPLVAILVLPLYVSIHIVPLADVEFGTLEQLSNDGVHE